ncbi:type VII secretion integral membrane protein EccD [Aeromicrobium ginsengisoli]|uniref:Type VII secretion integral membrane protein EccD n=1 Tax=Aeromicrobium ginsengisoli TaxID=363867 RepID=A0A5M4FAX7_9ACTN|nr:type VII secretion integral membrane protein EccD [Aeromicrobium ginsengisoli]KAA1395533.1 type VII secretion integral membrane protein EccD [Aeromicrobium ginsengisoli]
MLTAYSRVTVVTTDRTIDLALPNALPLADVLPQVMRYAAPDNTNGSPTSWTLAHLGGASLSLAQTLGDAGVLDGDILELRAQDDDVRPVAVEDVRDTVEDSVDASGGVWSTLTTRSFTVILGVAVLTALGVIAWAAGQLDEGGRLDDVVTPTATLLTTAILLFVTWWSSRFARVVDAQVAAAGAMVFAALAGAVLGDRADVDSWEVLAITVVSVALVAGIARLLTPAATGHLAVGAVVLVAGLSYAIVGWTDVPVDHYRRILPVVVLMVVGVIPLVSLSVGGLASADYRVRHVGRLDLVTLRARYRASNAVLIGSLVGISLVVAWGGIALDLAGSSWDRTLALTLAAAAILRSRLFSRTPHMLPLRVAGIAVVVFAAVRFAVEEESTTPWLVVAIALVLLAAVALSTLQMSEITRARVKRWLNVVEFLVVVDLLVVLFGALGIYEKMGGVF